MKSSKYDNVLTIYIQITVMKSPYKESSQLELKWLFFQNYTEYDIAFKVSNQKLMKFQ